MNLDSFSKTDLAQCFSASYAEAYDKFKLGVNPEHSQYGEFVQSQYGPEQELLAMAYSWSGSDEAPLVLVTQSATHGVEGFAGSAIQLDALTSLSALAGDELAILHIHAVNPYGFAWLRRVNEDGVDLNRNFIDYSQPLPRNDGYDQLAELLVPQDDKQWQSATDSLMTYKKSWGQYEFELAVSSGQYHYPDGLFYGGTKPSWSRQCIETIMTRFKLAQRQRVAVVDIHTGLGPYGYGEVICDHPPGSQGVAWARAWYGDKVTEPALGTSTSVPKMGLIDYAWQQALEDRVCFVTLEFGTDDIGQLFEVLRRDHVLHRHEVDWHKPQTQAIKSALRQFFYPAKVDWQRAVLAQGRQVLRQAIAGLQNG